MDETLALFIVCPTDPDPVLRFAAEELQRYLREAGGICPRGVSSPALNGVTFELAINTAADALHRDAFGIGFSPRRIKLAGGSSRAVLYAVYAFLEEYLGCRWFYPGEDIVPKYSAESLSALLNRLTSTGASKTWAPDFRVRVLRYLVYALDPGGTERDRLLDQAKTALTEAAHLDEARQARAGDHSLLPLHWDATGHGPHCVFRPGAPRAWLERVASLDSLGKQ